MTLDKFTIKAQEAVQKAQEVASRGLASMRPATMFSTCSAMRSSVASSSASIPREPSHPKASADPTAMASRPRELGSCEPNTLSARLASTAPERVCSSPLVDRYRDALTVSSGRLLRTTWP